MQIATDFQFSQHSLQDFDDCPMRFCLRYVERLRWPALQSEPALESERFRQAGDNFHRMAHQYFSGVPADRLAQLPREADMRAWWQSFRALAGRDPLLAPQAPAGVLRFAELTLSAPFAGFRLQAKYDLVAVQPGVGALIYDWKTGRKGLDRRVLASRLQTAVYRCLMVAAGACLNGGDALRPEQVQMIYWSAAVPDVTHALPYSPADYDRDQRRLQSLVQQIASLPQGGFAPAREEKACRFCEYRSLCGRGERAAGINEMDGEDDLPAITDIFSVDMEPF